MIDEGGIVMPLTEDMFEQAVLKPLEKMGYTHIYAPDMNRTDYSSPIARNECLAVLQDVLFPYMMNGKIDIFSRVHSFEMRKRGSENGKTN